MKIDISGMNADALEEMEDWSRRRGLRLNLLRIGEKLLVQVEPQRAEEITVASQPLGFLEEVTFGG